MSQWQMASSLSKSHKVLSRTKQNYPQYYTLTYMEEEEEDQELGKSLQLDRQR